MTARKTNRTVFSVANPDQQAFRLALRGRNDWAVTGSSALDCLPCIYRGR